MVCLIEGGGNEIYYQFTFRQNACSQFPKDALVFLEQISAGTYIRTNLQLQLLIKQ
jgi:hypothetical protein